MALLELAKGREKASDSGYTRVLGNARLGHLVSRVHACSISAGSELENLILERVTRLKDVDEFLAQDSDEPGVFVASKQTIKDSTILGGMGSEPDFVIFRHLDDDRSCHVVELKDGDNFDTKKAQGEYDTLTGFIHEKAQYLSYRMSPHFCCFNQNDKSQIIAGFKRKISTEEALTGREFCELLQIDYEQIVASRQADAQSNFDTFLAELAKIEEVRNYFLEALSPAVAGSNYPLEFGED